MIPSTAATLLAFVLFIAPGLVYEAVRAQRRVPINRSGFREASWVVLVGLLTATAAFLLLAAVQALQPAWLPNIGTWIQHPTAYFSTHYKLVGRSVLVEVLLASLIGALIGLKSGGKVQYHNRPDPALWKAFNDAKEDGTPFVSVRLSDETRITGVGRGVDWDAEGDSGYLVVESPIVKYDPDGTKHVGGDWYRVVVPLARIEQIWLRFVKKPDSESVTEAQPNG